MSLSNVALECRFRMSPSNVPFECRFWMSPSTVPFECPLWMCPLNVPFECRFRASLSNVAFECCFRMSLSNFAFEWSVYSKGSVRVFCSNAPFDLRILFPSSFRYLKQRSPKCAPSIGTLCFEVIRKRGRGCECDPHGVGRRLGTRGRRWHWGHAGLALSTVWILYKYTLRQGFGTDMYAGFLAILAQGLFISSD